MYCQGGEHYVDVRNGNDLWDGSSSVFSGGERGPKQTIQAGVEAAGSGDVVIVADGRYVGPGNRDIRISDKAITVRSAQGAEDCIIDCENLGRGFILEEIAGEPVVVEGFTIMSGVGRRGGGIYCRNASVIIRNCIIRNNRAISCGGGIYCEGSLERESEVVIIHNEISNNHAMGLGGGIDMYYYHLRATIVGNEIVGNSSARGGGGIAIFAFDSPLFLFNNTISGNRAPRGGGISFEATKESTLRNCIVWGNESDEGSELSVRQFGEQFTSKVFVDYCDLSGGSSAIPTSSKSQVVWGSYNLDAIPQFVGPGYFDDNGTVNEFDDDFWTGGDYQLEPNSPVIDAGDNGVLKLVEQNIFGPERIVNTNIDMGAYEFRGSQEPIGQQGGVLRVTRAVFKRGRSQGRDSFIIMGYLEETAWANGPPYTTGAEMFEGQDVTFRVGPFEETLASNELKWVRGHSELSYRGKVSGIVRAKINVSKGTFFIAGKKIDLWGLTNPTEVVLSAGDYALSGQVDRLALNRGKGNPLEFLGGLSDQLVVASVKHRSGKASDSLVIRGYICMDEEGVDLTERAAMVQWGDFEGQIAIQTMIRKSGKNDNPGRDDGNSLYWIEDHKNAKGDQSVFNSEYVASGGDRKDIGSRLIQEISALFTNYDIHTEILAASFRNFAQLTECLLAGADILTVPAPILQNVADHPLTNEGMVRFFEDSKVFDKQESTVIV